MISRTLPRAQLGRQACLTSQRLALPIVAGSTTTALTLGVTFTARRNLSLSQLLQAKKSKNASQNTQPAARPPIAPANGSTGTGRPQPLPFSSSHSSSRRSGNEPQEVTELIKSRGVGLVGAGIIALVAGIYISQVAYSLIKGPPGEEPYHDHAHCQSAIPGEPVAPTGRPATLDEAVARGESDRNLLRKSANAFDQDLNTPELLAGIMRFRKKLSKQATGHVLEVAVGTGRNLGFYDWTPLDAMSRCFDENEDGTLVLDQAKLAEYTAKAAKDKSSQQQHGILSYTGVDISEDMMAIARTRLGDAVPALANMSKKPDPEANTDGRTIANTLNGLVRLFKADATQTMPYPPEPIAPLPTDPNSSTPTGGRRYDTVIQTFGLCSVHDPVQLLRMMAAAVRPGTGRILLLEHGLGTWDWFNTWINRSAPHHFRRFGCWWNRDIEAIVREAAAKVPGLEVVRVKRPGWFQFGTTLMIELRVNKDGKSE